jgi:hypothetical protein
MASEGVQRAWVCVGDMHITFRYAANIVECPTKVVTDQKSRNTSENVGKC